MRRYTKRILSAVALMLACVLCVGGYVYQTSQGANGMTFGGDGSFPISTIPGGGGGASQNYIIGDDWPCAAINIQTIEGKSTKNYILHDKNFYNYIKDEIADGKDHTLTILNACLGKKMKVVGDLPVNFVYCGQGSTKMTFDSAKAKKTIVNMFEILNGAAVTKTDGCKDGVYYKELTKHAEKSGDEYWTEGKLKSLMGKKVDASVKVWAYITHVHRGAYGELTGSGVSADDGVYHTMERITEYLHVNDIAGKVKGGDIGKLKVDDADPEVVTELKYRYIDLMLTYGALGKKIGNQEAVSKAITACTNILEGKNDGEKNDGKSFIHFGVTTSAMTRDGTTTSQPQIHLVPCMDALDSAFMVKNGYSIGNARTAAKSTEKSGTSGKGFYDRFLGSIQNSVDSAWLKADKAYSKDVALGSAICSRIIPNRLSISDGKVSWGNPWNSTNIIEGSWLTKSYKDTSRTNDYGFGAVQAPANTGDPRPDYKVALKIKSTTYAKEGGKRLGIDVYNKMAKSSKVKYISIGELDSDKAASQKGDEAKSELPINDKPAFQVTISPKKKTQMDDWETAIDSNKEKVYIRYLFYRSELKKEAGKSDAKEWSKYTTDKKKMKLEKGAKEVQGELQKSSKEELMKSLKGEKKIEGMVDGGVETVKLKDKEKMKYRYKVKVSIYLGKDKKNVISGKKQGDEAKEKKESEIKGRGSNLSHIGYQVGKGYTVTIIHGHDGQTGAGVKNEDGTWKNKTQEERETPYPYDEGATVKLYGGKENPEVPETRWKHWTVQEGDKTFEILGEGEIPDRNLEFKMPAEDVVVECHWDDPGIPEEEEAPKYMTREYASDEINYAEVKHGTIYKEDWEAMAGVPTTRNLYFAAGGNEFAVEIQVENTGLMEGQRTYRSLFNQADCEFKKGDSADTTFTVDSPEGASSSDVTLNVHNGDVTVTATWQGEIPNKATAVTNLHTATCTAVPDRQKYNEAKQQAQKWVQYLNSQTDQIIQHTSESDKELRKKMVQASITSDNPVDPIDVTKTEECQAKPDAKPPIPCAGEMATAEPSPAGKYTITVTGTVPAHCVCGPCCMHVLKSIEDNWVQKIEFETLRITEVHVWKIERAVVDGMQVITYDKQKEWTATIKQGDPNIFFNIAEDVTSLSGRLRYSIQPQQHDDVLWTEKSSNGLKRTDKCDGTATTQGGNPIPAGGKGHEEEWATGCLYNHTSQSDEEDWHKKDTSKKTSYTQDSVDDLDKATEEWKRFDERRNMENEVTVISDFLILQTSSGDQSICYYDKKSKQKTQIHFDKEHSPNLQYESYTGSIMREWDGHDKSAIASNGYTWSDRDINIGSYNGKSTQPFVKYEGTGNHAQIKTAFDDDPASKMQADPKASVAGPLGYTKPPSVVGGDSLSSPKNLQLRMDRVTNLRMFIDNIRQDPTNPNAEYDTGHAWVYYKPILNYNSPSLATANDNGGRSGEDRKWDIRLKDTGDPATSPKKGDTPGAPADELEPEGGAGDEGDGAESDVDDEDEDEDDDDTDTDDEDTEFSDEDLSDEDPNPDNDPDKSGSEIVKGQYANGVEYWQEAVYSDTNGKVNNIVVQDPVSVQYAEVVALDPVRDQRTTIPEGSAESIIQDMNNNAKCTGDPNTCEYRHLNCRFYQDLTLSSFDFTPADYNGSKGLLDNTTKHKYELESGVSFGGNQFGTGDSLLMGGIRQGIPNSDMGLNYLRSNKIHVSANIYVPSTPSRDIELISWGTFGLGVRAGSQRLCIMNKDNIIEYNQNVVGQKVKVMVEFSSANLNNCKLYINNGQVTSKSFIKDGGALSRELSDEDIGDSMFIGSQENSDAYGSGGFYIDNLVVVRKAGSRTHDSSCYVTTSGCKTVEQYTCERKHIYKFNGGVYTYTAPYSGSYKFTAYGAQVNNTEEGDLYGGAQTGTIYLKKNTTITIRVGGLGSKVTEDKGKITSDGYNGGISTVYNGGTMVVQAGTEPQCKANSTCTNTYKYTRAQSGNGMVVVEEVGHVHDNRCTSVVSLNNVHDHSTACITGNEILTAVLNSAANGDTSLSKKYLGDTLTGKLNVPGNERSIYTYDLRAKEGVAGVNGRFTQSGSTWILEPTAGDSSLLIDTNWSAKAVTKVKVTFTQTGIAYNRNASNYRKAQLFFADASGQLSEANSFSTTINTDTSASQTISFLTSGSKWSGDIRKIRLDLTNNVGAGGRIVVSKIELLGYGIKEGGTSGIPAGTSKLFSYTGGMQSIKLTNGRYRIRAHGAQGGPYSTGGGKGGYSEGIYEVKGTETLYIGVGGMNRQFNGGGYGTGNNGEAHNGGGATHVALAGGELKNLISQKDKILIVAGGGGANGGSNRGAGGVGGGANSNGGDGERTYGLGGGGGKLNIGGSSGGNSSCYNPSQIESGRFGAGGNNYCSHSPKNGSAGGGGGYYGGGAGGNDCGGHDDYDDSGAGGGSGYADTTKLSDIHGSNGENEGDGYVYIDALESYSNDVRIKYAGSFGSMNGSSSGVIATVNTIKNNINLIPKFVDGIENPVFSCNGRYNRHQCDSTCVPKTYLDCSEPHHDDPANHYSMGNRICWEACNNDKLHQTNPPSRQHTDGTVVQAGRFINLDYYFDVYFPNLGDFIEAHPLLGIDEEDQRRGLSYVQQMDTTEWTREKRIRFPFTVDYLNEEKGRWEEYRAYEWIEIPVTGPSYPYYHFYCTLDNSENVGYQIEYDVEAINNQPSPGGKTDPYKRDYIRQNDNDVETNKQRFPDLTAKHTAYKVSYIDVVGRIGNFVISDTGDYRFCNMFKQVDPTADWLVPGIMQDVNQGLQNWYLSWWKNKEVVREKDGTMSDSMKHGEDIRGVQVERDTGLYDTYFTQQWKADSNNKSGPVNCDRNTMSEYKYDLLKVGYDVQWEISTIGNYTDTLQVMPYYYTLNIKTGVIEPVDVWMIVDDKWQIINKYDAINNADWKEFSTGTDPSKQHLHSYIMSLNWEKEKLGRMYDAVEASHTTQLASRMTETIMDSNGNPIWQGDSGAQRMLTIPHGEYYAMGNLQLILAGKEARTFIGSSNVNNVIMNGGHDTNVDNKVADYNFWLQGQRWHLKLGLPSSAVVVPVRNGKHVNPGDLIRDPNNPNRMISAYQELRDGHHVILMTAKINAIGEIFVLKYEQGKDNGVIDIGNKRFTIGNEIPNLIAVYDLATQVEVPEDWEDPEDVPVTPPDPNGPGEDPNNPPGPGDPDNPGGGDDPNNPPPGDNEGSSVQDVTITGTH